MADATYVRTIPLLTAGLWSVWEPQVKSELMRWGLWRLCTGEEILPPPPTAPIYLWLDSEEDIQDAALSVKLEQRHIE
jgi:hypothetical protein